ncbi:hypothetical protein N7532_010313 [Penicillium argentinense]|uniref:Ima1 N-terminal domain-containing protein n=1 Tax=Penicillium argentinense TaxID=1131581 RepID=A0A9W9EPD5_9EURO|nr:uncharacterized protein N7532_010313 [Penicillium argentinense]KAJ5085542.1 hypothetical protein N7532_010313 [Penicillium argentinense]
MALFSKRLACFCCGYRSNKPIQAVPGGIRKFHCDHCEADNYIDQNGEITDPPTAETNPHPYGSDAQSPRFESIGFEQSDLFCSRCVRNQHLLTHALAAYQPPSDDPSLDHESHYVQYQKSQESLYPQVCDKCEPRVRQRIKQAGYEAKADHLRRMMDQTRAGKTARQARNRSWQSLLVYIGALFFWASIAGQLAWSTIGGLTAPSTSFEDSDIPLDSPLHFASCVHRVFVSGKFPTDCAFDLSPAAGHALVAGFLSLWWNPKLRMKIEGRSGRFKGLTEYYEVQFIALVVRCVFWSLLKDPSASGIEATLPAALHMFMIIFTILSVCISRRAVKFDIRPLVNWSDNSWEKKPLRSTETSPVSTARASPVQFTPTANNNQIRQRFPFDKLAGPRPAVESSPAIPPTPPPESDDMDWTPTKAPQEIQPRVSVYQRNRPSSFEGPSPFHGSLPAAPQPPAWKLRQTPVRHTEQIVDPNPFHRSPPQQTPWQHHSASPEPVFRPPRFFPSSDHDTATGLETLFDNAFDLGSDKAPRDDWNQPTQERKSYKPNTPRQIIFLYLRLILLLASIVVWVFSQNHQLGIPGNYIETCALGSASLISGFALLEVVKRPLVHWNGMEILVLITELGAAVHLGAHLPQESFEREYFDRYGKLLLAFMAIQEALNLFSFYRDEWVAHQNPENKHRARSPSPKYGQASQHAIAWSPTGSSASSPTIPQADGHPLSSFPSFQPGAASISSALPSVPKHGMASSTFGSFPASVASTGHARHSFTMDSLRAREQLSDYEQESDSETISTEADTLPDTTNFNIRYGHSVGGDGPPSARRGPYSPRRNDLGPGLGGLSLEDRPTPRRMTRSQTQQSALTPGRRFPSRVVF